MRPTTLVLVRHGHVADNDATSTARLNGWTDAPLTDRGKTEAHALANRLAHEPPSAALYTSTLVRARHTAHIIGAALGLRAQPRPALREISCGFVDGWPLFEVQSRYPQLWARNMAQADEDFCWPGGETYRYFRTRVLRAVQSLAAAHRGQRIVVVTHAGAITQILGALHNINAGRWGRFRPGTASVTEVHWQEGASSLVRFDDRTHL